MRRGMSVAGSFYPATCEETEEMIAAFNEALDEKAGESGVPDLAPEAIVVPHAGYIYSGFTANIAYRVAASRKKTKRVVVIGPSHRVGFAGISGGFFERYETPCGDLPIDGAYLDLLSERFGIGFLEAAHYEHSTEVQMPFVRHYFGEVPVVECVYSEPDRSMLADLVAFVLEERSTLLVVSTDLSHYYSEAEAGRRDAFCIRALSSLDPGVLSQGCEACGMIGLEALIVAAKRLGLESQILNYRTSAEVTRDTKNVVGYLSAAIFRK